MEKLVVVYTIGDGCTWSTEITRCVEYSSAEEFYVDLEDALKAKRLEFLNSGERWWDIKYYVIVGKSKWVYNEFYIDGELYMPDVYGLYEWYEKEIKYDWGII